MSGEFGDPAQRLASLKTELGIAPAEEAAWDGYAKTVADTEAAMKEQAQKAHETVKAAAEKLVASLSDAQKTKAKDILSGLARRGPGRMRHAGIGGPMMQHGDTR